MKPRPYQLTLLQMMALVALCAFSLALLETPAALAVVAVWAVVPGIVIDRFRGGEGIVGGALAGVFASEMFIFLFAHVLSGGSRRQVEPMDVVFAAILLAPFGLIFGALLGHAAGVMIGFLRPKSPP